MGAMVGAVVATDTVGAVVGSAVGSSAPAGGAGMVAATSTPAIASLFNGVTALLAIQARSVGLLGSLILYQLPSAVFATTSSWSPRSTRPIAG